MQRPRLAILGASGFVGSTLCERLFRSRELEFRPLVHSFANTSRLARFPLELVTTHRFGLKDVDLAIRSVGGKGVPDVIHASLMPWE